MSTWSEADGVYKVHNTLLDFALVLSSFGDGGLIRGDDFLFFHVWCNHGIDMQRKSTRRHRGRNQRPKWRSINDKD